MLIRLKSNRKIIGSIKWLPKYHRYYITLGSHSGPLTGYATFQNIECLICGKLQPTSARKIAALKLIDYEQWQSTAKCTAFLSSRAHSKTSSKLVDEDRSKRGDFRTKPTQYWFLNCRPKNNFIFETVNEKEILTHDDFATNEYGKGRSLIHPDYANRFIREFILWRSA